LLPAVVLWLYEPARSQRRGAGAPAAPLVAAGWKLAVFALFALALLSMITFYVLPTQLPFFLQTLAEDAPSRTGLAMGTLTLVMAVTSLGFARVRGWLGIALTLALGLGLLAAGIAMVGAAGSYAAVVAAMAVAGAGMGVSMPNLMAAALTIAPSAYRGRVAGGLTASFFIGQFVSPFLSQPLVAAYDFATMFLIIAAVLAVVAGATGAAALGRRPPMS
jgi:MFS family permease